MKSRRAANRSEPATGAGANGVVPRGGAPDGGGGAGDVGRGAGDEGLTPGGPADPGLGDPVPGGREGRGLPGIVAAVGGGGGRLPPPLVLMTPPPGSGHCGRGHC